MKYEVRKEGKVYMSTEYEECKYGQDVEESIQSAGYAIYINGKRQPKRKKESARKKSSL